MNTALAQIAQPFSFNMLEQMVVVNGAVGRLLLACVLGGAVGLERELNRKSAGVRTNLLICMGAAFFTLLSPVLAGEIGNNKGQVASNIVQGIGFLGAGLIIHNRTRVSGLASAASIWVAQSHRALASAPPAPLACSSLPEPWARAASFRCMSGCLTPWKAPRLSLHSFTRPPWSRPASFSWRAFIR